MGKQAPLKVLPVLERQLQTELKVPRVQRAGSLAELTVGNFVVSSAATSRQYEVRPVEYIEALRFEPQTDALGELKSLCEFHVRVPEARSDERVTTQVAHTAEARIREGWQPRLQWIASRLIKPARLPQVPTRIKL